MKDFETLKKYADDIGANIRTGTQLNEMRISILMLKVSLLKTISSWKSKLISLADIKKKEDKSVGNNLSRHPSGNNISSGAQSLPFIPPGCGFDATSQSSADIPKMDGAKGHMDLSAKLSADSLVDENISATKSSAINTATDKINTELEDSCIDIVNFSYISKNKDLNTEEISSSTAPPAAVLQPSYTQNVVAVSKAKWNSRESSNSLDFQLLSPFSATLHADLYLKPGVLVDESQPSSVIAYTLASNDYRNFVENSTSHKSIEESNNIDASENSNEVQNKHHSTSNEKQGDGTKQKDNDDTYKHFKHSFRDDTCDFYCKVLFAKEFETFRERTLNSRTDLILSLSECSRFKASGGKSGVKFFKTIDGRFLLKELSRRTEARDVSTFIPKYLEYVTNAHTEGTSNTLLAKIFGVFDVGCKNHETGRQSGIMFVLMENLTYDRPNITGSYDLKGSRRYQF